jgi:predicted transcriptional regulator
LVKRDKEDEGPIAVQSPTDLNEETMAKTTAKEQMLEIIQEQPEDSSYDEILRELAFARMVERGLEDSEQGRTLSNEEMEQRIVLF